jgi:hypothetical protein
MESNIQITLTKSSAENEIKTYFQKVLELKQSGEEFPVNLELIWPLVYGKKSDAVEVLKRDFIQCVDYQVLRRNPQNSVGGRPSDDYRLSVSCVEYFIARKVRPVFEVYRQVFHKAAETKPLSTLDLLELTIKGMRENQQELQEVKKDILELKAKTTTRPEYFTIAGYGTLHGIHVGLTLASMLGRKAAGICKARGIETDRIPDPRFGEVKTYPVAVLDEVFEQSLTVKGGAL